MSSAPGYSRLDRTTRPQVGGQAPDNAREHGVGVVPTPERTPPDDGPRGAKLGDRARPDCVEGAERRARPWRTEKAVEPLLPRAGGGIARRRLAPFAKLGNPFARSLQAFQWIAKHGTRRARRIREAMAKGACLEFWLRHSDEGAASRQV